MLYTQKDTNGNLQLASEYLVVNHDGNLDPAGFYIWIQQLEINSSIKGYTLIKQMIKDISRKVPHFRYVYWQRKLKTGKRLHMYTRVQLMKLARRD